MGPNGRCRAPEAIVVCSAPGATACVKREERAEMDATGATERDDQIKQLPILIVDDQKANVRLLERLLVREGYAHVEGITDPSQAREACVRIGPQLVLLDLHMPDVDGFEVMSALREAGLI